MKKFRTKKKFLSAVASALVAAGVLSASQIETVKALILSIFGIS